MKDDYDVNTEVQKHQRTDAVILHTPAYWMGVPWTLKKYMDLVCSAGMSRALCDGDARTPSDTSQQYVNDSTLFGKKYLLSLTFNAPRKHLTMQTNSYSRANSSMTCFSPCT